jgi:hypothetical protein
MHISEGTTNVIFAIIKTSSKKCIEVEAALLQCLAWKKIVTGMLTSKGNIITILAMIENSSRECTDVATLANASHWFFLLNHFNLY